MAEIHEQAEAFKAALLKRERAAAVRMVKAYGRVWLRLKSQIDALTKQIEDARARGEFVNPAWLQRQNRYFALLRQVTEEVTKFADLAERQITAMQRAAVNAGRNDSKKLLLTAAESAPGIEASFDRISPSAVENIVGFLGNGSPLKTMLDELPRNAGRQVANALVEAVTLGRGPRATASRIRAAMGGDLARALKISRTETLRAYRETTHQTYRANADVLEGWYWLASLSSRTCPACIALNGTFHPLTERQASHVNCRCSSIPGLKGQPPPIEHGERWFEKQSVTTQRDILGSEAAFQAFKAGKISLTDLVGRRDDPRWGASYYHLSLKRALNGEGRFPGDAARPVHLVQLPPEPPRSNI